MISVALLTITLSVLMHVTWNLLARHVDSRCNYIWWAILANNIILGPWAIWSLIQDVSWSSALVLSMTISAFANGLYMVALRQAYLYAPVALVYPVARSSPVLIALWTWLFFNQSISDLGILAIAINAFGLWIMASTAKAGDAARALPWMLAAAFATSIYSISDQHAVASLPSMGSQVGLVVSTEIFCFMVIAIFQWMQTGKFIPPCRPKLHFIVIGGLSLGLAYALTIRAMQWLPAAHVVAFTNLGIILATLLSIWLMKEREHFQRRILAALIITVSLVLLKIDVETLV